MNARPILRWQTLARAIACLELLVLPVPSTISAQAVKQPVLLSVPEMDRVTVRSGIRYKRSGNEDLELTMYYPPGADRTRRWPTVVFVFGYSDAAASRLTGTPLRLMGQYVTWAKLVAASGFVGITYATNRPLDDLRDVMRYLRANGDTLQIDTGSIGIWACSGNAPVAAEYLTEAFASLRAAVFYYGLLPTADGHQRPQIDSLSRRLGFYVPDTIHRLSAQSPPVLIVRAGKDNLQVVKASTDHFAAAALAENVPLTLINYADGHHAFDIADDTEATRDIIRRTLTFLAERLQRQ